MKKCPYCGNLLPETAIRCKFCRKTLSKIEQKETMFHKYLRTAIPQILKYSINIFIIFFIVGCVILSIFFIFNSLSEDVRRDIIEHIKGLSLWGWLGLLFILGCLLFLFDLAIRRRQHFEEDIRDVCCFHGGPTDYNYDSVNGTLEIGDSIIFKPYGETLPPFVIPIKDVIKVRTGEKDLKDFSLAGQWASTRSPMLGVFVSQNYLYVDYRTNHGEKTIMFRTHRATRQNKILKNKIEEKLKTEE